MNKHILVVDDEPDIRQLLSITLSRMGYTSLCTENTKQAYDALNSQSFNLCISDLKLPDGSGLDIVEYIKKKDPQLPVIVITAHGSMDAAIRAMKLGAFDFINKPFDLKNLRALIENAIAVKQEYEPDNKNIIGMSDAIKQLQKKIHQVSRSQAPIFINGESGSGKELVARAIHSSSARKSQPFIAINCGAIPKELMESEFFGHQKGSFTGAHQDKQGLFQAANGGTLLLDEIADLPLDMQVKLLRVIQEKCIRPIGTQLEIPVDIRLISATHQNLLEKVNEGAFRNDLFYRVNVIDIHVPPLRDRLDDVALLSTFILGKISQQNNAHNHKITASALQLLETYRYPGNIRELENILERACALSEGAYIEPEHLLLPKVLEDTSTEITQVHTEEKIEDNAHSSYDASAQSIDDYLENIEKDILLDSLNNSRWNRTATAKILGISFRSLRYRLKKLGIDIDNNS